MGTPYCEIIHMFLDRMEKDSDFFSYSDLPDYACLEIARERAGRYLQEAIARLVSEGQPDVDLLTSAGEAFTVDLTPIEKQLLVSLMVESYHLRDIEKLACMNVNYTAQELRVFDPSAARTSFLALFNALKDKNAFDLGQYRSINRTTGRLRKVEFT